MYQCAGICYSRRSRGQMSCIVRLSEPLLKLRSRKELIETLLHEMIHAFNFIRGIHEVNGGHGKHFLDKMREINRLAGTDITVYHTFHDEVELYKKHWWRCDGVCKVQKPYFGYVKRTSNRAPGPNDFWWNQHKNNCGGSFIKVKEPEKPVKKTAIKKPRTTKKSAVAPVKENQNLLFKIPDSDLRNYFPDISMISTTKSPTSDIPKVNSGTSRSLTGTDKVIKSVKPENGNFGGVKLGGNSSGRSRLLDMFEIKKEIKVETADGSTESKRVKLEIKSEYPDVRRKSVKMEIMNEFDDDDDIILIDDEYDDYITVDSSKVKKEVKEETQESLCHCPICNEEVETNKINGHIDECLTVQLLLETS